MWADEMTVGMERRGTNPGDSPNERKWDQVTTWRSRRRAKGTTRPSCEDDDPRTEVERKPKTLRKKDERLNSNVNFS